MVVAMMSIHRPYLASPPIKILLKEKQIKVLKNKSPALIIFSKKVSIIL